MKTSKS